MRLFEKTAWSASWFKIGIVALLLLSLGLRFWGLERFNTLVFDEVYYAKAAHHYLSQTPPEVDGHPPLSKYLIAIGIWLGNQLPIGQGSVNSLAGDPYTTWSYRWLDALTGSCIPLVVAGLAYQLTHRRSYALIAGLFAGLDGLFLVESRYALNNVYLVLFGLLGLWFLLLALESRQRKREAYLVASGIFLGASASVKWNGLWFLLSVYSLWLVVWGIGWVQSRRSQTPDLFVMAPAIKSDKEAGLSPLARLSRLRPWQLGLYLGVVPAAFYRLSWIPYLQLNHTANFWQAQQQLLDYHERVGGPTVHPYCSNWYTWIAMLRPIAYFYQVTAPGDPLPTNHPTPPLTADSVIYDVHAIGNPMLWWLSSLAIVLVLWVLVQRSFIWLIAKPEDERLVSYRRWTLALNPTELWLALFLAISYAANLLPWVRVSRCLFLYHYMESSVFATLALAWMVDRWLCSTQARLRLMGVGIVLVVMLAFIFWLPIYLGLPLSPVGFDLRMWLKSWV